MSNIKELIRREIERRIEWLNTATTDFAEGRRAEIRSLYDFLATLPDEPEQPTRGYDEAYLNEKIAKASKSWEGIDVDKFMDEVRGREPVTDCHELMEAAEKYADGPECSWVGTSALEQAFIAGAEWQKRKRPKVKGYGVMRKMEGPHPDDWYMDERGKEHCWGYKFNEPCPWPADVYIMEAKEGAEQ